MAELLSEFNLGKRNDELGTTRSYLGTISLTIMTGQEILNRFHNHTSDELDTDYELELANDAMHEIEEDVQPEGLKKVDTFASTTVGQTYTTAIPLPDDFFYSCKEIYVGPQPYTQVPFERAVEFRDVPHRFYIDHANASYHLTGTQALEQTISFPYYYATPDITLSTSPVWPTRFHGLIPLKMAEMYSAIDQGEKQRAWDDRWGIFFQRKLSRFKDYDASLKLAAMDHSVYIDSGSTNSENRINAH